MITGSWQFRNAAEKEIENYEEEIVGIFISKKMFNFIKENYEIISVKMQIGSDSGRGKTHRKITITGKDENSKEHLIQIFVKEGTRREKEIHEEIEDLVYNEKNCAKVPSIFEKYRKYISIELIDATSLYDFLEMGEYSEDTAREIAHKLGTFLALLHNNRITHGDFDAILTQQLPFKSRLG